MWSIGKRAEPGGIREQRCACCCIPWPLSKMRLDRYGRWVCPQEPDDVDGAELAEERANAAAAIVETSDDDIHQ